MDEASQRSSPLKPPTPLPRVHSVTARSLPGVCERLGTESRTAGKLEDGAQVSCPRKPPIPVPRSRTVPNVSQSLESPSRTEKQEADTSTEGSDASSQQGLLSWPPLPPPKSMRPQLSNPFLRASGGQMNSSDEQEGTKAEVKQSHSSQPPPRPPKNRRPPLAQVQATVSNWSLEDSGTEESKTGVQRSGPLQDLLPPPSYTETLEQSLPMGTMMWPQGLGVGYPSVFYQQQSIQGTEGSKGKMLPFQLLPPPLPPPYGGPQLEKTMSYTGYMSSFSAGCEGEQTSENLMEWWNTVNQWDAMTPDNEDLNEKEKDKAINKTVDYVQKGLRVFDSLCMEHTVQLHQYTTSLLCIADDLSKFHKKARIAAITGGTGAAVGGVAAIAGLVLAPVTLGASLAMTAVGVGVATAGGVTGASAAITDKVNNSVDRKKVDKIICDYQERVKDIRKCLIFVTDGMEKLKKYNSCKKGVSSYWDRAKIERTIQAASPVSNALQITNMISSDLSAFSMGIDICLQTQEVPRSKKKSESKAALKTRRLAEQLLQRLAELVKAREELQAIKINQ
nr:PREDICTED: uncharacterized protein LOC107076535 isoform X1 [Lepisosteus oculatus]XP_015195801.1 PREDICTED: uncharacterized protein LOC107076535 isoform X1 [Lepisosteus oculatus]